MKAVLPMAGRGTRFFPLSLPKPKGLINVLNKPLLQWTVEFLIQNNINEIIFVLGPNEHGEQIKSYFSQLGIPQAKFYFAYQKEPLGTAHVLQMTKDFFSPGEKVLFMNGDDLYSPEDISNILKKDYAVLAQEVQDPERWGIFKADNYGNLEKIHEKPQTFVGNTANTGCYLLDTEIFDIFDEIEKSPRGEYEITDSVSLFAQRKKVRIIPVVNYWLPIGYPWHLLNATEILMSEIEEKIEGTVEPNVTIKGKLVLGKGSVIKSGTYVEGNLVVGENTEIGPFVHLEKNVIIGNNSKITSFSSIKNSVIGNNTRIESSYISDSILGDNINFLTSIAKSSYKTTETDSIASMSKNIMTLIKDKLIESDRAEFGTVIGDNVLINENTIIFPGVKIWPNSYTEPRQILRRDLINKWE